MARVHGAEMKRRSSHELSGLGKGEPQLTPAPIRTRCAAPGSRCGDTAPSEHGADLLFQIISQRYEGAIIVSVHRVRWCMCSPKIARASG